MRRLRLFAPLGAMLLAGCIDLAPAYHRPTEPTPASFPTGPAYPPAPTAAQPVVGWRDFFSDPKLKAVIELTLANNRDLRVAVANIAEARAQYRVQRAALFPTISAQGAATLAQEPASVVDGGVVSAAGNRAFDEHIYTLTAGTSAYQVDLFGKIRDLTRAQQDRYFATRAARDATQISLVSEVAADYLTIGADRALLAIAQDTLRSSDESLAVTEQRLTAGVATGLDVSQAQTLADQARFDVARLTTQVAQDRNALDLVVGAPVNDDLLPTGIADTTVVLERLPAAINSGVLLERPDVLEAEQQLRAANTNIGAARAAFFPDIELTASGGLASIALSALFRGSAGAWSFAPTITQTLFDAGANRGNLDLAKAQRDAGRRDLREDHPDRVPRSGRRAGAARHDRRRASRAAGAHRRLRQRLPALVGPLPARRRYLSECADRRADALHRPPDPGRQPTGQADQPGDAVHRARRRIDNAPGAARLTLAPS